MSLEPLHVWMIEYALNLLFWLWIIKWGGAEWLADTFIAGFIVNLFTVHWSPDVIKFYGWLILIGTTVWFIIGMAIPDLRFHWALF